MHLRSLLVLGPLLGLCRATANEVIYLSNCYFDNGGTASELDYYSDYLNSRNNQAPDAKNMVSTRESGFTNWENGVYAKFPSGVTFSALRLDSKVGTGQQTGIAFNSARANYTCYKENWNHGGIRLYRSNTKTCIKIYSCSKANYVSWTETQLTLSADTARIYNGDDGPTAFSKIEQGIDGTTCNGKPIDVGHGCHMTISCDSDLQEPLHAMAALLATVVGPKVNKTTASSPGCDVPACYKDLPPKCCKPVTVPVSTFPRHGRIVAYNRIGADLSYQSFSASLDYKIVCPDTECNGSICSLLTTGIGSVIGVFSPPLAPLGAILPFGCNLACGT